MNLKFIFKILDKEEWNKAKKDGKFSGSPKDINDGFIHFSEEEQVKETLKKYYIKTNNNIVEKADKVIEKILNELDWDYLSQPARIKLLQTLLPYRLPKLKDSETSLPSLPNKVDIQIIGRKEEPTIDI